MADNDNTPSSSEMLRHRFEATRCEPTLRELGRKLEEAMIEERLAWDVVGSDKSGDAWQRADMLQGRTYQLAMQILQLKATTREELRIKVRAALWTRGGELDVDDGIDPAAIKSIFADLLAA